MLFFNASASSNTPSPHTVHIQSDWYNDAQKRWEGSAHSPDTVAVIIMVNGKNPISVPVSGGRFSWTPSQPLPDGEHVLTFVAVDRANNQSDIVSVNYNIDTIAPDKPQITAIEDYAAGGIHNGNSIKRHGYTNDANPVVRGEAEANSLVYIYNKNSKTPLASVTANQHGKWEVEVNLPNDGAYELSAVAEDRANNRSQPSLKWPFQLDTEKPDSATINYFEDDVGLYRGQFDLIRATDDRRPELYGTGDPNEYVRVQYASKNGSWVTTATVAVDSDGTWLWTPPQNLSDGEWNFRVRNIDHAGNVSKWSSTVTLLIDTTTIQPLIMQVLDDRGPIESVLPGQNTDDARLDFIGKAEVNSLVILYQDGTAVGSAYANSQGDWRMTPQQDMRAGLNNFGVKAIDEAGNESAYSANYPVRFIPSPQYEANYESESRDDGNGTSYLPIPGERHIYDVASWLNTYPSHYLVKAANIIFSGENQIIDFAALSARVEGLQKIDISGKGNNLLNLDLHSLLNEGGEGLFINDDSQQLMIDGDMGDRITLDRTQFSDGWLTSQNKVQIGGENWTLLTNSQAHYTLLVNQEIEITYG